MAIYDYYDGFAVYAGPVEIIKNIEQEFKDSGDGASIELTCSNRGKYARLYTSIWWGYGSLMEKYPEVECYVSEGEGKYGGCNTYYSPMGDSKVGEPDIIYRHSSGAWEKDTLSPWEEAMFIGESSEQSLTIVMSNGTEYNYSVRSKANMLKTFDALKKGGLTVGFLADICCPYVANNKKKEFIDSFVKKISSAKEIAKVHCTSSTISRSTMEKIADKLSDVTLGCLIQAYAIVDVDRIYDFTENNVTEVTNISANLYTTGEGYKNVKIDEGKPVVEKIVGIDESSGAEFAFGKKDKNAIANVCLTDAEEIVIPETDPSTGNKVVEIGTGCFKNCPSVKKIVVPATVKTFNEGCFTGPKKLTSITFQANEDGSEDYADIARNKVSTYVTLKTEYILPDDVKTIGNKAFAACTKLKKVVIHPEADLLNESLCGCKSLKTLSLAKGVTSINVTALEKAAIKELELSDGSLIKFTDKYMYSCIEQKDGISFSYEKAAKMIKKASTEANRFKIAVNLLEAHGEEVKTEISALMDIAIRYCIGKSDAETLTKLLNLKLDYDLDFSELADLANRIGSADVSALILSKSGTVTKKNVVKKETPAEAGPKLYIKVRFEDNKAYSYFCSFKVKPGDKVFVGGKKSGEPGEVLEILNSFPTGRAAMYTLAVEKAFNVETVEVGDLDDLDDLPDLP